MKKKKNVLLMILATVVAMLVMSVNVWAAQKNPLAKMPTKMKTKRRLQPERQLLP